MKKLNIIPIIVVSLLTACSSNNELYAWDKSYEPSLYSSLQREDKDINMQISNMDETIHKANSQNKKVPPGFYAQLGYLHGKLGNTSKMRHYFSKEKSLYPESTRYMNFLLAKNNKPIKNKG